jgi:hypothetical protein
MRLVFPKGGPASTSTCRLSLGCRAVLSSLPGIPMVLEANIAPLCRRGGKDHNRPCRSDHFEPSIGQRIKFISARSGSYVEMLLQRVAATFYLDPVFVHYRCIPMFELTVSCFLAVGCAVNLDVDITLGKLLERTFNEGSRARPNKTEKITSTISSAIVLALIDAVCITKLIAHNEGNNIKNLWKLGG